MQMVHPMRKREHRLSLLINLADEPAALARALEPFAQQSINLTHIESRPAKDQRFDIFVNCEGQEDQPAITSVIAELQSMGAALLVLDDRKVPWFPRHISELDEIANGTLDAGQELTSDHPGFNDQTYRKRRGEIDALARSFRHGQEIPFVEYTAEENQTWHTVCQTLRELHERHACRAYLMALEELQAHCEFSEEKIPQGQAISQFLTERTGFRLRPVAGLLSSRDFLNGLAFKVFFCTQYIRHPSTPLYTPEPDLCHELLGHAPMFADQAFADFSQEIGLASLGASDAEVTRLARCYWHSVEFGLVRERGELKAYGAGLLSSFGELQYACEQKGSERQGGEDRSPPKVLPWIPEQAADQDFPITDYQPLYFAANSLQDAKSQMREFCRNLSRPFYARFNPASESIWVDRAITRSQAKC